MGVVIYLLFPVLRGMNVHISSQPRSVQGHGHVLAYGMGSE